MKTKMHIFRLCISIGLIIFYGCSTQYLTKKEKKAMETSLMDAEELVALYSSLQNLVEKQKEDIPIVVSLYPKEIVLDSINQPFIFFSEIKNISNKTQHFVEYRMSDLHCIQGKNTCWSYPYCINDNGRNFFPYFEPIKEKYKLKPKESTISKWEFSLNLFCWHEKMLDSIPFKFWLTYNSEKHTQESDTITISIKNN